MNKINNIRDIDLAETLNQLIDDIATIQHAVFMIQKQILARESEIDSIRSSLLELKGTLNELNASRRASEETPSRANGGEVSQSKSFWSRNK